MVTTHTKRRNWAHQVNWPLVKQRLIAQGKSLSRFWQEDLAIILAEQGFDTSYLPSYTTVWKYLAQIKDDSGITNSLASATTTPTTVSTSVAAASITEDVSITTVAVSDTVAAIQSTELESYNPGANSTGDFFSYVKSTALPDFSSRGESNTNVAAIFPITGNSEQTLHLAPTLGGVSDVLSSTTASLTLFENDGSTESEVSNVAWLSTPLGEALESSPREWPYLNLSGSDSWLEISDLQPQISTCYSYKESSVTLFQDTVRTNADIEMSVNTATTEEDKEAFIGVAVFGDSDELETYIQASPTSELSSYIDGNINSDTCVARASYDTDYMEDNTAAKEERECFIGVAVFGDDGGLETYIQANPPPEYILSKSGCTAAVVNPSNSGLTERHLDVKSEEHQETQDDVIKGNGGKEDSWKAYTSSNTDIAPANTLPKTSNIMIEMRGVKAYLYQENPVQFLSRFFSNLLEGQSVS